jgi:Nif-specific regulatory protein
VVIENVHNNINYLNKLGTINTNSVSYIAVPIIQDEALFGVISANISKNSLLSFYDIVRMLTIVGSLFGGTLATQKKFAK